MARRYGCRMVSSESLSLRHRGTRLLLLLLALPLALGSLGTVAAAPLAAAAPAVTKLECGQPVHAGQFDAVWLVNQGDAPVDLAGWHLRSDPENSQQMDLGSLGSLAPGE